MPDDSTPTERLCTRCGLVKPIGEFYVHITRKDGYDRWCKICKRSSVNDYRIRNNDQILEKKRAYRKANQEKVQQAQQRWVERNRDHLKDYQSQRRQRLSEKLRAYRRDYFAANPYAKQAYSNRRKQAPGAFTVEEWEALVEFYGHRCLACGRHADDVKLTVDHVVPLSSGGTNDISNIQPLCMSCNASKSRQTIDYRPHRNDDAAT